MQEVDNTILDFCFSKYLEYEERDTNKYLFFAISFFLSICEFFYSKKKLAIKNKKTENKICTVVFSANQLKIAKLLKSKGVKIDIYPLYNKEIIKKYNLDAIRSMVINRKVINVHNIKSNKKLNKNKGRILKILALKSIIESLVIKYEKVINFNDHSPYNLLLFYVSKKNELPVYYVQHATISENFPPLYHDKNLLFSEDSFDKYRNPDGKSVKVIYDIRLPSLKKINKAKRTGILICPNLMDSYSAVLDLYTFLINNNKSVAIRPHPRDDRFNSKKFNVTSNKEVFKDLNKFKYIVCNESAILLEAIHFQNFVYKYLFSESIDNYGYLEKGLLQKEYKNKSSLLKDMDNEVVTYSLKNIEYFVGNTKLSDREINSYLNEK